MPIVSFSLCPFQSSPAPGALTLALKGVVKRDGQNLCLTYVLQDADLQDADLQDAGLQDAGLSDAGLSNSGLVLVEPVDQPQRRDRLWETTCFEFFLGLPETSAYWEFNLSPAGHWNVYRFSDYRTGMATEERVQSLPIQVTRSPQAVPPTVEFSLDFDLRSILGAASLSPLQLGITSVIQARDGSISYWALHHPGPEADFHRRDSFVITL